MKYKIKKETKPALPTFGKYKAVAVHDQTVDKAMLYEEISRRAKLHNGDVVAVMIALSEVVNDYLRKGYRVRLPEWGLMKLEIESEKVDDAKDFREKKHIRGVRLHFLPESIDGSQALYEGITFEKVKE